MKWIEAQAQSKEGQEIAEHFNIAAKKMVDDIATHQSKVVKNAAKAIKDFTQWVEPGSDCKSDAFASCLADENRNFISAPTEAFEGKCARDNKCNLNFHEMTRTHHLE